MNEKSTVDLVRRIDYFNFKYVSDGMQTNVTKFSHNSNITRPDAYRMANTVMDIVAKNTSISLLELNVYGMFPEDIATADSRADPFFIEYEIYNERDDKRFHLQNEVSIFEDISVSVDVLSTYGYSKNISNYVTKYVYNTDITHIV